MKWFIETHIEKTMEQEKAREFMNEVSKTYFRLTGDILPWEVDVMCKWEDDDE